MSHTRLVVGASGDGVRVPAPSAINMNSGAFTFGGVIRLNTATSMGLIRVGTPTTAPNQPTRGLDMYVDGSSKLTVRADSTGSTGAAATALTTGVFNRIAFSYANRFSGAIILNGANDLSLGGAPDPPLALTNADIFGTSPGMSGISIAPFNGLATWLFYLQGFALAAATIDAYMQDPRSFWIDYGPRGRVSAGALLIQLACQQESGVELDKSGQRNNGALIGTSISRGAGPVLTQDWFDVNTVQATALRNSWQRGRRSGSYR